MLRSAFEVLTAVAFFRCRLQVVFDQSYDFADSVALVHVETGLPLKESRPDAPDPSDGTVVEGPPVSWATSSARVVPHTFSAMPI